MGPGAGTLPSYTCPTVRALRSRRGRLRRSSPSRCATSATQQEANLSTAPTTRLLTIFAHAETLWSRAARSGGATFYGKDWRSGLALLLRYWVKHIGCRLVEDGVAIHPDLPHFLSGASEDLRHVSMGLEIREDIAAMMLHLQDVHGESGRCLWLGPATHLTTAAGSGVTRVRSHVGIDWLRLWYQYDYEDPGGGADFLRKRVRLPHGWSLNPLEIRSGCRECHPEANAD